ncbi:GNAT family N-acetyltransferase [Vreelandella andesensis]|uniref:GNAT family N-acetyltransferase n=1 Tax=Vreelandella andesensis TaxID=447567 RepID=A0A433KPJ0_9GAMM|nr:GNAT family N-acetyltransferase [Halomonas andesensis]RUR31543.1 GNAT family N-acetyltransferase [Halomonas andesensis]
MIDSLSTANSAELQALEAQANSGISAQHLRDALTDVNSRVIGYRQQDAPIGDIFDGNRLLGYAIVVRLPFESELQAIGVLPHKQGQGVGGKLLGEVVAWARQWQSERLLLEVRANNQRAIRLYQHYGFNEDGRRRDYYPAARGAAGREDALLMSRLL